MLAIVEHEQGRSCSEGGAERGEWCVPCRLADAEGGGHRDGEECGIGEGGEFDHPDAPGEDGGEGGGEVQGEARLAAAADASQREQPRIDTEQEVAECGECVLAPDERGARRRYRATGDVQGHYYLSLHGDDNCTQPNASVGQSSKSSHR